jgi:hypothetical protein
VPEHVAETGICVKGRPPLMVPASPLERADFRRYHLIVGATAPFTARARAPAGAAPLRQPCDRRHIVSH